jgi:hypothetical protein
MTTAPLVARHVDGGAASNVSGPLSAAASYGSGPASHEAHVGYFRGPVGVTETEPPPLVLCAHQPTT